jgi:hypothetical protein
MAFGRRETSLDVASDYVCSFMGANLRAITVSVNAIGQFYASASSSASHFTSPVMRFLP